MLRTALWIQSPAGGTQEERWEFQAAQLGPGAQTFIKLHPSSDSAAPHDGQQGQAPPGLLWTTFSPCSLPKPRQEGPLPGSC